MTREAFIRKWLANPQKQYNEQYRDEMRDDLDLVIEAALRQPHVSNSLPVDYLQNEMIKAIKELAKESTAPDKDTPDWMENDIKRGMQWMHKRLTGNDC